MLKDRKKTICTELDSSADQNRFRGNEKDIQLIRYSYFAGMEPASYTVEFRSDGSAFYSGHSYESQLNGEFVGECYDLDRFIEFLNSIDIWNFADEYVEPVCDGWSESITVITSSGKRKHIESVIGLGPVELWAVFQLADHLKTQIRWCEAPGVTRLLSYFLSRVVELDYSPFIDSYTLNAENGVVWGSGKKWGKVHVKKDYVRIDLDFPVGAFTADDFGKIGLRCFEWQSSEKAKRFHESGYFVRNESNRFHTVVIAVMFSDVENGFLENEEFRSIIEEIKEVSANQ